MRAYSDEKICTDEKSRAVRSLARPDGTVVVFPGRAHRLTRAERVILETRPVQRMSRLRQTGLAYLTIPTNENTRLPHCLGTAYWSARFVAAMRGNHYSEVSCDTLPEPSGNQARLAYLDAMLGPGLSLELLVRLYALVHDSDLLPFGHTLSYQLGYYPPPGDVTRFQGYLAMITAELESAPILLAIEDPGERAETLACLRRHMEAVEAVATSTRLLSTGAARHSRHSEAEVAALLPVYTFVETLVTATVSADLLDFSLRDTLGAGTPWLFDTDMLRYMCVFATSPTEAEADILDGRTDHQGEPLRRLFRFGVGATLDGRIQHHAISHVSGLLRVRHEVLERIVYSAGKCVADAMLDRGIRNVNAHHAGEPFPERDLLTLGDDQFLDLIEAEERTVDLPGGPVMGELKSRRLWKEAYHLDHADRLSASGVALLTDVRDPAQRDLVEEALLKELPGMAPADLVIGALPLGMQMKEPDILIGWHDGEVLPLGRLAATTGYGGDCLAITERYASLWSLSVYTRDRGAAAVAAHKAAAALFES
ncbi:hypothetical protein J5X84_14850 [Streptosporangiaceae bacterium NEAU-GS5]|nr:hypothetical protein [Streptosporangiaceae bacterium NEAU-GS5]